MAVKSARLAAAAGDLSRRLLLQRVSRTPVVAVLAPPTCALVVLAFAPARGLVAGLGALAYVIAAVRTVRATARALGVRALSIAPG